MNKEEKILVKQTILDIAKETSKNLNGINTPEIKIVIDEVFEVIKKMLLHNSYIVIQGFGVFYTDYLDDVDIKDPRNNNTMHFSKRRVPRFYFSRSYKKQLKEFDKKK